MLNMAENGTNALAYSMQAESGFMRLTTEHVLVARTLKIAL
jgi:hypothetical protein